MMDLRAPGTAAPPAYAGRARAGLTRLGEIFGLDAGFGGYARDAVTALFQGWGDRVSQSGGAAPGPAPYEYSVALATGHTEVRVFLRPLPATGAVSPAGSWEQGWRTLELLGRDAGVPVDGVRHLTDLFRPTSPQAASGLLLAASVAPGGVGGVKVYLDGVAAGLADNGRVMGEGLARLGYGSAWQWLQRHYPQGLRQLMPSLAVDLVPAPAARTKLYTFVQESSPAELERHLRALPGYASGTAADFADAVGGSDPAVFASTRARPMLCWSMTARSREHPDDATLYLPFREYVPDPRRALERLAALLDPDQLDRVAALCAHTAATGDPVNPFHWAAIRLNRPRRSGLTLYVAAGLVDPPVRERTGPAE